MVVVVVGAGGGMLVVGALLVLDFFFGVGSFASFDSCLVDQIMPA